MWKRLRIRDMKLGQRFKFSESGKEYINLGSKYDSGILWYIDDEYNLNKDIANQDGFIMAKKEGVKAKDFDIGWFQMDGYDNAKYFKLPKAEKYSFSYTNEDYSEIYTKDSETLIYPVDQ